MHTILVLALLGLIGRVQCRCSRAPITDDQSSVAYACIHGDLDDLQDISEEAQWIEFSVTRFQAIPERAFARFRNLRRISFYNCHVNRVSPDAFAGLPRLEWLVFHGTGLHVAKATWFRNTPSLKRLLLDRCGLIHVEPELFRMVPQLETLSLRDNDLDCIPVEELANLRMLRSVRIDGNPWLCECRQRLDQFFKERNIVQEERCLPSCAQCMTQIAIPVLPLAVTNNQWDLTDREPTPWKGSRFETSVLSSLDRLPDKTTWIQVTGLRIDSIPSYAFFRFGNSLRSLELNDCGIDRIENGGLAGLHKLERLVLSGNRFRSVEAGWFRDLVGLRQLILRGNQIERIETGAFADLATSLRHLDIRDNRLRCLPVQELERLKHLERLDPTGNPWTCECWVNLHRFLMKHGVGFQSDGGHCDERNGTVTLNVDDGRRRDRIEVGSLGRVHWTSFEESVRDLNVTIVRPVTPPSTQVVHVHTPQPVYNGTCYPDKADSRSIYTCTGISSIEELGVIPPTARTIRVNLSKLGKIPERAFARFNGYLSRLELRECGIDSIEDHAFTGLYNLEYLSLHSNQLDSISSGAVQGLSNLRDLDLSRNQIYRITNDALDSLPYLRSLDISDNSMNCISVEHIAHRLRYLSVLRVSNNPWSCLCGTKLAEFLDARQIRYDRESLLERNEECYATGIPTVATVPASTTPSTSITTTVAETTPRIPETVEGRCIRYQETKYRCTGGNLLLLRTIPVDASSIEFQEGDLPYLPAGWLGRFPNLEELIIRNSGLRTVEEGAFDGLHELTSLTVQDNPVESVGGSLFVLKNLERLDLRGNSIKYIAPGAFRQLDRLGYLNLEGNDLRCIFTSDLNDMPNINVVEFSGNPLKWRCRVELEQFLEMRRIKFVYVDNSCEGMKLVRNILAENLEQTSTGSNVAGTGWLVLFGGLVLTVTRIY